jgi:hypothetical protein
MAYTYEEVTGLRGDICIRATDGNIVLLIPADPANSDYQRYLAWLENPEAEHFTPIVIDEAKTK